MDRGRHSGPLWTGPKIKIFQDAVGIGTVTRTNAVQESRKVNGVLHSFFFRDLFSYSTIY